MGGSGSGGSSGKVDFPDYMKDRHAVLFDEEKGYVKHAIAGNPYVGAEAWSPECMYNKMGVLIDFFDYQIGNFEPFVLWNTLMESVPSKMFQLMDNPDLDKYIETQKDKSRRKLEEEILPKFRKGMQDVGAVMTSAFKIGEALLWSKALQDEETLEGEIKGKLAMTAYEQMSSQIKALLELFYHRTALYQHLATQGIDVEFKGYTAFKEYTDSQLNLRVSELEWPMNQQKYLQDCLGSISGSAAVSSSNGGSRVGNILGMGALGAAAGSFVPAVGPMVGGTLGAIGGLFS